MLCANQTVEEKIVFLLRKQEVGGRKLHELLAVEGIHVSLQATYNALKKLVSQEVVLKNRTIYSLNYVWLKRLNQFSQAQKQPLSFEEMSEGDKYIYHFNDLNKAGAFWMHIHQVLMDTMETNGVVVLYSSNEWTSVIRKNADIEWAAMASNNTRLSLFAIGQKNAHNILYKKEHGSGNLQINIGKSYGFHSGYYLNVFNDYVVELVLPQSVADKINKIFDICKTEQELRSALDEAGVYSCRVSLIVKRNKKQAQKLFKKVAKDFYIAKRFLNK